MTFPGTAAKRCSAMEGIRRVLRYCDARPKNCPCLERLAAMHQLTKDDVKALIREVDPARTEYCDVNRSTASPACEDACPVNL